MKMKWIGLVFAIPLLILSETKVAYSYSCNEFVPILGTVLSMRDQGIHKNTTVRFLREYSRVQKIGTEWSKAFMEMTDEIYSEPPVFVSHWLEEVLAWCKKSGPFSARP